MTSFPYTTKKFILIFSSPELELISRYPCVLSAPYLSEDGMKPKGRIAEPDDDDKILRFLYCKETGGFFGWKRNNKTG